MAEAAVPNLIRLAGEPAVRAYREFLDEAAWHPVTRSHYRKRAGRFFVWAESRGLSLEMIDAGAFGAYAEEIAAAATSTQVAHEHLTPVRGVLRHLARSGVLAVDPCPKGQRGEAAIPNLIRLAGETAVRAYREFLDNAAASPRTRKNYRQRAGAFFRWAESRGLNLEMIDDDALNAYAGEIAASSSWHTAYTYLTAVRRVLIEMGCSGVLTADPCAKDQSNGRAAGFPLLDLLAMLGHMAEASLRRISDEEAIALALLQQVRWPAGPECPHCGADDDGNRAAEAICPACAKRYSVTTGTMFEDSPVPVRLWLVVMRQMYLAESALPDDELGRRFELGMPAILSLRRRIEEAVVQEGLPIGEELARALDVRNRELGQEGYVRAMKDYMALEAERDRLLQARVEGTPADGLPPGMALEEALAWVEARLAEHDKHVIVMQDGYLVKYVAESEAEREGHAALNAR